jgi:hypothetical protein
VPSSHVGEPDIQCLLAWSYAIAMLYLAALIDSEGVGCVCTDHSAETLQRLAVELADEIAYGKSMSAQCRALSKNLFSPEAAVKQIAAALDG